MVAPAALHFVPLSLDLALSLQKARPRVKLSSRQHQQMVRWVESCQPQQASKDRSYALEASALGVAPGAGLRKVAVAEEVDGGV